MQNHKKLIVWQKADMLAFEVYKATEKFPKSELFGITSQLRRASLSVPVNIVEGYGRRTNMECWSNRIVVFFSLTFRIAACYKMASLCFVVGFSKP